MERKPQPTGVFAQARARYGRSTVVQLLIFSGMGLAADLLYGIFNTAINLLFNVIANWQSGEVLAAVSVVTSTVLSLVSLVLSIGMLFLCRSLVFRSVDRVACTVVPQIGLIVLSKVLSSIGWRFMYFADQWAFDYFFSGGRYITLEWVASVLLVTMGFIVLTALGSFARAGTIRLARMKGKWALCILPLLAMLLLAFINGAVSVFYDWAIAGMRANRLTVVSLLSVPVSFVISVINRVFDFFAQRMLIYRDTCDTTPAVRRDILRRWQEAQGA